MVDPNSPKTNSASSINLKIKSSICTTSLYSNEAFLKQKYVVEKMSARQISVLIGCAHSTVLDALRRFGITAFNASIGGHIPYGFKLKLGRRVSHVREQKIISQIHHWKCRGWSNERIAIRLTSRKGPPPEKGQRWYGATFRKILARNRSN